MSPSDIYFLGLGFFCGFVPTAICWYLDRMDLARELRRRGLNGNELMLRLGNNRLGGPK